MCIDFKVKSKVHTFIRSSGHEGTVINMNCKLNVNVFDYQDQYYVKKLQNFHIPSGYIFDIFFLGDAQ